MNHGWTAPQSGGASQDMDHEMTETEPSAHMPMSHGRGHSPDAHRPQSGKSDDTIEMEVESMRPRALFMVPEDCFIHVLKFLSAEQLCTLARVSAEFSELTRSDMFWNKLCVSDYGASTEVILEAYASTVPRAPPAFWKRVHQAMATYRISLHFVSGPRTGDKAPVPMEGECMLGRSRQNTVCILHDEMVSRKHAKIVRQRRHYFIHDVGGINFTFVNKRVIPQHSDHKLAINDTIDMGSSTFIITLLPPDAPGAPGAPPPQVHARTLP